MNVCVCAAATRAAICATTTQFELSIVCVSYLLLDAFDVCFFFFHIPVLSLHCVLFMCASVLLFLYRLLFTLATYHINSLNASVKHLFSLIEYYIRMEFFSTMHISTLHFRKLLEDFTALKIVWSVSENARAHHPIQRMEQKRE